MKSEKEIREQLHAVYNHRLLLRISRRERSSCRNCVLGVERVFNLGEFGEYRHWQCGGGYVYGEVGCNFKCSSTREVIEREFLDELRDPSVCGSKEPKIASLLWVLHDGGVGSSESSSGVDSCVDCDGGRGNLSTDSDFGLVRANFFYRFLDFFRKVF